MLPLYAILFGSYLHYSKSKYFPSFLSGIRFAGSNWMGSLFILLGSALYVRSEGWAGGLLLSLAACSLSMILIQLFAVLGKQYFYGLMAVVHGLVLVELLHYAG